MNEKLRLESIQHELASEHRSLMTMVDQLEQHRSLVGLVPLLERLHKDLTNHFAREQFPGGLYEIMGAHGTGHHDELRVLIREHCDILSAVSGLLERARMAHMTSDDRVVHDLGQVVASVRSHERKEHQLASNLMMRQP